MSSPLIWVVLPILAGFGLWFLRKRYATMALAASLFCLLLALLAWVAPIGTAARLGPLSIEINPTLEFAGRRLVLDASSRTILIYIYVLCAFWFAGSVAAGANRLLIPFGLGITGLLVGALAVEPFLYAALLVEMAVLLAVPIFAPPGKWFGQGVLRFLIFQTLAMPFILLAGWALAGVEANPTNTTLVTLSTVFLGLGFAFWLAVFPFYTWIPLLAEQSYPYISGFFFLLLSTVTLLLGLNFLDRFGWLRALPNLYPVIGQVGALMIVTAGLWAAFQQNLSRLFGYGVIVETGFSLLAISLSNSLGLDLFASMFVPRMIMLGLWALSLSVLLQRVGSTRFEDARGMVQKLPFASAGLAMASLSLAGLPLLAVFPIRQVLMEEVARQSLSSALWALIGTVGMLYSTFRALVILAREPSVRLEAQEMEPEPALPSAATSPTPARSFLESPVQVVLLLIGISGLLFIGLFPRAFLPITAGLINRFTQLP